jgi:hypothetical protein
LQKPRLADPRLAVDQHDQGTACEGVVERRTQQSELTATTDERAVSRARYVGRPGCGSSAGCPHHTFAPPRRSAAAIAPPAGSARGNVYGSRDNAVNLRFAGDARNIRLEEPAT